MTWPVKISETQTEQARWRDKVELLHDLPQGSIGVELGVDAGGYSLRMLDIVKPRKLDLVDAWKQYPGMRRTQENHDKLYEFVLNSFAPEIEAGIVEVHRTSTQKAAKGFPEDYFDWIVVDADHTVAAVGWDMERYWPLLKHGGWMICHDYLIHEKKGVQFGAKMAVDDFLVEHQSASVVGFARAMTPFRAYPTIVLEKA